MRTPGACGPFLPLLLFLACGPSLGTPTTSATTGSGTTSETGGTTTSATGGTTGTSDSSATATTGAPTTDMTFGTGSGDPGTSGDASVSSGGNQFITPTDLPPSNNCDPWQQNCPEGQKCTVEDGFHDTHCVDIVPDAHGLGDPCSYSDHELSGHDECGLGLVCWQVDPDTGVGTCHAICEGGPDAPSCSDPAEQCWPICQSCVFGICVDTCDPRATDCPEGQLCLPDYSSDFLCIIDASGDEGQYGDTCEYVNVCDPGLFCTDSDLVPGCPPGAGCCSPFCDTDVNDCPDTDLGVTCVPWFDPGQAPAGLEDLGVCAIQP